jgi:hypothetical protein
VICSSFTVTSLLNVFPIVTIKLDNLMMSLNNNLFNTNRNGNSNNMCVKRFIYSIAIGTIFITFILKLYIEVHRDNEHGISISSSFRPLSVRSCHLLDFFPF